MEIALRLAERLIALICIASAVILLPLMIGVRIWEIFARNVLDRPSALWGYMEGEALTLLVFLSIAYAYTANAHVRVDIFRERMSPRTQATIELIGAIFFILPFSIIVVFYGFERILGIADVGQRCALGFGRPCAWIIQASLPFGIGLFAVAGLLAVVRNIRFLFFDKGAPAPGGNGLTTKPQSSGIKP